MADERDTGDAYPTGSTVAWNPTEAPKQIGPYKILEHIGEGGMGVVYLAEQTEPVRRRVALKIIKLGMDTKQVVARFEAERQALAMMNHPNVAKVFDAGATETGRPYFVMEHVAGVPITEHCDRQRLTIEERLKLFMLVCDAVQHAHQKGIIHRDIKPSNILVSADGAPKVIDFGVAKALHQNLTERTIFTEQGQLIGTPEYMSPEQAEMTAQDIDTRSDIYSLGVLLYELLTGSLPVDAATLRQAGVGEIQRIIREEEVPRPSMRLSSLGDDSASCAERRRADSRSLLRELRGDLDWITMTAMEKDRTRRYATASELAADVQRHLADEPVTAGRPSPVYRLRKALRRHRVGVAVFTALMVVVIGAGNIGSAAVLTVMGAFVVALVVSVAMFRVAEAARKQAVRARNEAERSRAEAEAARNAEREQREIADSARDAESTQRKLAERGQQEAERQAEIATAVNEFLNDDLLAAVAPSAEKGKGRDIPMREVLDEAANRIEAASGPGGRFEGKPLVEASIRDTLGTTYRRLGEYDAAEPRLRQALELRRAELGEENPDTLRSIHGLAFLHWCQGRYTDAEPLYVKALRIQRRVLGEEHPETLLSMYNLGLLYEDQARYEESEALWAKTLDLRRGVLGEAHPDTLLSMYNLAGLYDELGRYDEAEPLLIKAMEGQRRLFGEDHPDTLRSMNNLAILYTNQLRYDEAEPLCLKALETSRRVLGEDHPDTLTVMHTLAWQHHFQGRCNEEEPLVVKTLESRRRVLGEDHEDTLASMNNLALVYKAQGRYDQAEPLLVEALETQRRVLGEEHPRTVVTMSNLGDLYVELDRPDQAECLLSKAVDGARRAFSKGHWRIAQALQRDGRRLLNVERFDDAEAALLEANEILETARDVQYDLKARTPQSLVDLYDAWGKPAKTAEWRAKVEEITEDTAGEESSKD